MNAPAKIEASLASAMAAAFGEIEAATKDAVNPAFKQGNKVSKYADLTAVIAAIKPALIKHSLFFTQHPEPSEKGVTVETWLHHAGGESLALGKLFVPANKNDAQGYGSALTYARRYALVTAFGVPVEDDDGNAAAKSQARAPEQSSAMPDAEYTRLVQLVEATNTNVPTMFKALGIRRDTLRDLDMGEYEKALSALNAKLAKMAKAETDALVRENA